MPGEMAENIRIERMMKEEVPQVYVLERISFSAPWDISTYYRELDNPASYFIVTRAHDQVIGYAGMWVIEDEAHIVTLAVAPAHRRRGIGRCLMEALLEEARRRRARRATLEVRVTNIAAQRLYAGMGFRTISYRLHYYPDTGEDAAVMLLKLPENGNAAR